jgi:YVTN family beta-propeller protein
MLTSTLSAFAGQAPGTAEQPDIAVSGHDRFYTSDQFSNTVSVINPASNKLLGVIRLGDPTPGNLSPLYPAILELLG